jgi:hypothetical protein
MVIYLPAQASEDKPMLDELTPREIVRELDKYVIGQADAKKAVAIALRNRIRRQKLEPEMAEDVMPKNGNCAAPGEAGEFALPESGSEQVYRSRVCWPGRRVHDSRSSRNLHRHGAR